MTMKKGTLNDGRVVAVKQLSAASHQGKNQFVTEIAIMSAVQHRNLVKLRKKFESQLVKHYDICLGVARGLAYLHEESRLRIVHRDVKASNILLDSDLIPKISDFGLAKLYDDNKSHISTGVARTIGYLVPKYAMRGHLTEKTDVFAFGIVALEMVSGRRNSDSSLEEEKMYLLEWVLSYGLGKRKALAPLSPTNWLGNYMKTTVKSILSMSNYQNSIRKKSLRNDVAARGTVSIYYDYSESSSMVGYIDNSPVSASKPMLGKAIKQGR
uniref:non-specific serine/threonine protein kinase n=1 Tax=Quercus lobata TaxID=97700 RepID=A0A7N2LGT1_QUELO